MHDDFMQWASDEPRGVIGMVLASEAPDFEQYVIATMAAAARENADALAAIIS